LEQCVAKGRGSVEGRADYIAGLEEDIMTQRQIASVHKAPGLHWVGDGFRVAGYLSTIPDGMRRLSPFLLLDYHPEYSYTASARPRGVGVHPHRGFETVTLAWQGSVAHHDSAGNGGVIGPGDAQWMTAASGILHKEYHEAEYARRGGPFQMAQLWVNLPRQHKMDAPRYQALVADQMGQVTLPDGAGQVRVIAGEYDGVRGPAKTFTPVQMLDVHLNAGGKIEVSVPARDNAALLIMAGDVTVNGQAATTNDFVLTDNVGDRLTVAATSAAHVLVLGGEPIDEPIVPYGPFVMNSRREILEAIDDFNGGKFGELED
jgi:redox-sensitive bicupin YhaK (pirin superfamily)